MRILIISFFVSAVCAGQGIKTNNQSGGTNTLVQNGHEFTIDTAKKSKQKLNSADSLLIPVFSTKEVMDYLYRIEKVAASIKNLRLPNDQEYTQLVAEMNMIIVEMDKKRKGIK